MKKKKKAFSSKDRMNRVETRNDVLNKEIHNSMNLRLSFVAIDSWDPTVCYWMLGVLIYIIICISFSLKIEVRLNVCRKL